MASLITPNVQWGDFYSTWSGSSCPVLWTLRSVLFEHSLPRSMDFHPMSSELTVQQQTHGPSVQISGVFSLRNSFSAILTVVSSCLCFPELRSTSSTHWNGPFPLILPLLLILPCGLGNSGKGFQGFRAQLIFLSALGDHSSSLSSLQCLKELFQVSCPCFHLFTAVVVGQVRYLMLHPD